MKNCKRFLACLLCAIMLMSALPLVSVLAEEYNVGDIIQFGLYPQSEVKDEVLIAELNKIDAEWISYGYYSGHGTIGSMFSSDYMMYKDISYNGDTYRGVTFSEYRPYNTIYEKMTISNTSQADNGYYINNTYWFKYEPLNWIILDSNEGLVMCNSIIDSQPYNNTIYEHGTDAYNKTGYWNDTEYTTYANNYAKSSIREWLNNCFYNTAFSDFQKNSVITTTINNEACRPSLSEYDSEPTSDNVFILSYFDVDNSDYGYSCDRTEYDINRRASGTDYAKCQGLWVNNDSRFQTSNGKDSSTWWLRSAGSFSGFVAVVNSSGFADTIYENVYENTYGVRPAMMINLDTYDKSPTEPSTEPSTSPDDSSNTNKDCSHMCHKGGFVGFIWKIVNFFFKTFRVSKYHYCSCGKDHWA